MYLYYYLHTSCFKHHIDLLLVPLVRRATVNRFEEIPMNVHWHFEKQKATHDQNRDALSSTPDSRVPDTSKTNLSHEKWCTVNLKILRESSSPVFCFN